MEDDIQKKVKKRQKYRLVIMNDETFEEIKSYRLTINNLYTLFSMVIIALGLLIVSLIVFTPIKRLIPGYAEVKNNREFVELLDKVTYLENEQEAQNAYINGIQNLLEGMDSNPEMPKNNNSGVTNVPVENLPQNNTILKTDKLDQFFFVSPVKGDISQGFIIETEHFGTDIIAPKNTAIKSILDGVVINADWSIDSGNSISIQHANNIVSVYKHNSVLLKKIGNLVKAGEAIAIIGNTGELTNGPHLHFELWYEGKPVNPEEYISF